MEKTAAGKNHAVLIAAVQQFEPQQRVQHPIFGFGVINSIVIPASLAGKPQCPVRAMVRFEDGSRHRVRIARLAKVG
jgi:hypothetical protein